MTADIRRRGFVFDVAENPKGGPVRLIDLNCFGTETGCGSCLFHWIRDAKVLYGLQEEVEVRVTLQPFLIEQDSEFLGPSDRPSILEASNPIKRLKERPIPEGKAEEFAGNGGIPHAYLTPVRWFEDDEAEEAEMSKVEKLSLTIGVEKQQHTNLQSSHS